MKRKQTKNLCYLYLSASDVTVDPEKKKGKRKAIATDIPYKKTKLLEVAVSNESILNYDVTFNVDIYGSDFYLSTDKITKQVTVDKTRKVISVLLPEKANLSNQALPEGLYVDDDNFFNIDFIRYKRPKPKLEDLSKTTTVINRTKNRKITRTKKQALEAFYSIKIPLPLPKQKKALDLNFIYNEDNFKRPLTVKQLNNLVTYFKTFSIDSLDKVITRTHCFCIACNAKNTLSSLDNNLSCSKCNNDNLASIEYKILYFYTSVNKRYELNLLTSVIKKQIEGIKGFKTILKGLASRHYYKKRKL